MTSMIRKVFEALKNERKKGDFYDLVQQDLIDIEIYYTEEDKIKSTKIYWKKYVHSKVKEGALKVLVEENETKSRTKQIKFEELEMSAYLVKNKSTAISKIIFSVRSGTLDLKDWHPWKYSDNLCVMCKLSDENIKHFMSCKAYGMDSLDIDWKLIYENEPETQFKIAEEIKRRHNLRKYKLEEVGLPSNVAPLLQ